MKEILAIVKEVDDRQQMAESLIENVHREDLAPIEKGRATYQLFLLHGIEIPPKELAEKVDYIRKVEEGYQKGNIGTAPLSSINNICKIIGKSKGAIRDWLEAISTSPEIQQLEVEKPKEERLDLKALGRLSTIEDESLQKKVYKKIVKDRIRGEEASRFITGIKRIPEERREEILESDLKVDVETLPMEEVKIEIAPEVAEEIKVKYEELKREREELMLKPEMLEKSELRKNWLAQSAILSNMEGASCPVCGAGEENLRWVCHDLTIKEAQALTAKLYQDAIKGGKK
jgi:ParB-like chromosome segregation protein Spo0J